MELDEEKVVETLMLMHRALGTLTAALEALIEDPHNPVSAAAKARAILDGQ